MDEQETYLECSLIERAETSRGSGTQPLRQINHKERREVSLSGWILTISEPGGNVETKLDGVEKLSKNETSLDSTGAPP